MQSLTYALPLSLQLYSSPISFTGKGPGQLPILSSENLPSEEFRKYKKKKNMANHRLFFQQSSLAQLTSLSCPNVFSIWQRSDYQKALRITAECDFGVVHMCYTVNTCMLWTLLTKNSSGNIQPPPSWYFGIILGTTVAKALATWLMDWLLPKAKPTVGFPIAHRKWSLSVMSEHLGVLNRHEVEGNTYQ